MNSPEIPQNDLPGQARLVIQRLPEIGKAEAQKQLVKLHRKAKGVEKMLVARYFEALIVAGGIEE